MANYYRFPKFKEPSAKPQSGMTLTGYYTGSLDALQDGEGAPVEMPRFASYSTDAQGDEEDGNFVRNFKKSFAEVPQAVGGLIQTAGDLIGADGVRDYGRELYESSSKNVERLSRESDSLTSVLKGDANFGDWIAGAGGYVVGQALQAVATGGLGALAGRAFARQGIKWATEQVGEAEAKRLLALGATRGAVGLVGASNVGQEVGSVYPEMLEEVRKQGREPDGADKARALLLAGGAGLLDTVVDVTFAGRALRGAAGGGIRGLAGEIAKGAGKEAGTEAAQTVMERAGAQQSLGDADAVRDIVDSAAIGAVGGGGAGTIAGAHGARGDSGVLPPVAGAQPETQPPTDSAQPPGAPPASSEGIPALPGPQSPGGPDAGAQPAAGPAQPGAPAQEMAAPAPQEGPAPVAPTAAPGEPAAQVAPPPAGPLSAALAQAPQAVAHAAGLQQAQAEQAEQERIAAQPAPAPQDPLAQDVAALQAHLQDQPLLDALAARSGEEGVQAVLKAGADAANPRLPIPTRMRAINIVRRRLAGQEPISAPSTTGGPLQRPAEPGVGGMAPGPAVGAGVQQPAGLGPAPADPGAPGLQRTAGPGPADPAGLAARGPQPAADAVAPTVYPSAQEAIDYIRQARKLGSNVPAKVVPARGGFQVITPTDPGFADAMDTRGTPPTIESTAREVPDGQAGLAAPVSSSTATPATPPGDSAAPPRDSIQRPRDAITDVSPEHADALRAELEAEQRMQADRPARDDVPELRSEFPEVGADDGPGQAAVGRVRDELRAAGLGDEVAALEASGRLRMAHDPSNLARGMFDGERATLNAARIGRGEALSVLLHEVGAHMGLRRLIGDELHGMLPGRIRALAAKGHREARGAVDAVAKDTAARRADGRTVSQSIQDEETIAYFVQAMAGSRQLGARQLVNDVIAHVRALLRKLGFNVKVGPREVADMAMAAVRAEARNANAAMKGGAAEEGVSGSSNVRGVQFPTADSWLQAGDGGHRTLESRAGQRLPSMERAARTIDEAKEQAASFVGKPVTNVSTGLVGTVSRTNLAKMTSRSAGDKSVTMADHALAVANVDHLFEGALLNDSHPDKRGEPTIRAIHRFVAPMVNADGRLLAVKLTVKETTGEATPNPIYSIEAMEIESPPSVLSRANPDETGIRPQAGFAPSVAAMFERVNATLRQSDARPAGEASSSEVLESRFSALLTPQGAGKMADRLTNWFSDSLENRQAWEGKVLPLPVQRALRGLMTQYHKAQREPLFKPVFEAMRAFSTDTARIANQAASLAPDLLVDLTTLRDVLPSALGGRKVASKADLQAVSKAVFDGTLVKPDDVMAGKVWSDTELRARGLNDWQVKLYRQARKAIDQSMDDFGKAQLGVLARGDVSDAALKQAQQAATMADAAKVLDAELTAAAGQARPTDADKADRLEAMAKRVGDMSARVTALKAAGYAPLQRFGEYAVYASDPGGKTLHYATFDTLRAANAHRREIEGTIRAQHHGATIRSGHVNPEESRLFRQVSLDTLELFGDAAQFSGDPAWKAYIELTKTSRSSLKRLLERQGIAGYSTDIQRSLASFITSNSRYASGTLHLRDAMAATEAIPTERDDVKGEAQRLIEYVQDPREEVAGFRGLMFTWYLGGSIAAAAVNMTQSLTMTYPWLAQHEPIARATTRVLDAMKAVAIGRYGDPQMAAAVRRADADGITSPQQIYYLQAEQSRNFGNSMAVRRFMHAWGYMFGKAEQYNRRVAFVAAYRQAQQRGVADPYAYAAKAVDETQGVYSKESRPNFGRGSIGAAALTFKQYTIGYLEFLARLARHDPNRSDVENAQAKRAAALALGVLFVFAGTSGLPFMGDAEDLIDTIMQALGYNWRTAARRKAFVASVFGEPFAAFAERGVSPALPMDIASRLGMGNIVPGTDALRKDKDPRSKQSSEVFGVAGGIVDKMGNAAERAMEGDIGGALKVAAPKGITDLLAGLDMAMTGRYHDRRGRNVVEVGLGDALIKAIGFQPEDVSTVQRNAREAMASAAMHRNVKDELAQRWASAIAAGDSDEVADARAALASYNRANPDMQISITPAQLRARVKAINLSKNDRVRKALPKELRATLAQAN